ncbi:SCO2583/SCO2584 N-terminal domain-containing protein [Streptacidiphilus neutrinimicus]|uniref:SCO2583/SCO2584 N-terminal domain-containing protein n=1 Tax=Streptacidiphilus neutrinimicus TaxID=105420 RepID=UPI000693CE0E|nr:hypothetical protein [Streptacidiphilus neutrinimicus]
MPKIDDQQDDPFEKLVLDEDFVRAAEHKESSARARMLSARWKKNPPQDTSWRAPVVPLKPRRRRRWQLPLFVLLAAALVLVSMNAKKVHDWAFSKAPGSAGTAPAAAPSIAPALSASPTAAPPTPFADQSPDMQHPFAGSPADKWPSGAAGIALPAAKPIGIYSAHTVGKDEQLVKEFLVAALIDPHTVGGGYPQSAVDLLDPYQRNWLTKALAHPDKSDDPQGWISRFDPSYAVPVGDVRVQGETTLASDGDGGLLVKTDYDYVYAAHPAGSTDEVERVIARRTLTFRFYDSARYEVTPGTVTISDSNGTTAGEGCEPTDGFLTPQFQSALPSSTASGPAPSGPATDPYDLSKPLPTKQPDCGRSSRT